VFEVVVNQFIKGLGFLFNLENSQFTKKVLNTYNKTVPIRGAQTCQTYITWTWLTAKFAHFRLGCPPSPSVLDLPNMSDPCYMDLADCQVRVL
jgi:hypothetical protein